MSWTGPCSTWIVACISSGIFKELVKMGPSVEVAGVNGCLQGLRSPSVAGAEPRVVSHSGAELEVLHQLMGKEQQWEICGRWNRGGRQEGVDGEDGGGDTGKGVGGMVVSIALETRFCLVVMASEVMKSSESTWLSYASLMNWYSISPNITVSKHHGPCSRIEVWEVINPGSDCSKPIIKDNMKLRGDSSSVQAENQRDSALHDRGLCP